MKRIMAVAVMLAAAVTVGRAQYAADVRGEHEWFVPGVALLDSESPNPEMFGAGVAYYSMKVEETRRVTVVTVEPVTTMDSNGVESTSMATNSVTSDQTTKKGKSGVMLKFGVDIFRYLNFTVQGITGVKLSGDGIVPVYGVGLSYVFPGATFEDLGFSIGSLSLDAGVMREKDAEGMAWFAGTSIKF